VTLSAAPPYAGLLYQQIELGANSVACRSSFGPGRDEDVDLYPDRRFARSSSSSAFHFALVSQPQQYGGAFLLGSRSETSRPAGQRTHQVSATNRNHFAHLGKNRATRPAPCLLDDIEEELTIAQHRHHEPAPFERGIGQIVAPRARRADSGRSRSPLGALHDVMDIQPPPHAAGLATPARSREHPRPNRRPFGGAGSAGWSSSRSAALFIGVGLITLLADIRRRRQNPGGFALHASQPSTGLHPGTLPDAGDADPGREDGQPAGAGSRPEQPARARRQSKQPGEDALHHPQ
jgi:hypothetical protein